MFLIVPIYIYVLLVSAYKIKKSRRHRQDILKHRLPYGEGKRCENFIVLLFYIFISQRYFITEYFHGALLSMFQNGIINKMVFYHCSLSIILYS